MQALFGTTTHIVHSAGQVVHHAVGDVQEAGHNIFETVGALRNLNADDLEDRLQGWFWQVMHARIEQFVDTLPQVMKDAAEDPEMPRIVSKAKDKVIDVAWPDVKEEIMWNVAVNLEHGEKAQEEQGQASDRVRAFFRYHLFPFDRSVWRKLKDPVFIIFTLASLIPWAGMTPLIFLFIFIIIEHQDEYQLVVFILQFKGTQFLSHGVIKTLIGFFTFLQCVTVKGQHLFHTCSVEGPGVSDPFEVVFAGWLLQVALIWLAFFLLPFSKSRSRRVLKGHDAQTAPARGRIGRRGGYLHHLMVYDIICFLCCLGGLIWSIVTHRDSGPFENNWVVRQIFFAMQVIYGYTSLPFFLFTLPVFQAVLTHTVPTAYDTEGRCVKVKGPPRPKVDRTELARKKKEEAVELLRSLKQYMANLGSKAVETKFGFGAGEAAAPLPPTDTVTDASRV